MSRLFRAPIEPDEEVVRLAFALAGASGMPEAGCYLASLAAFVRDFVASPSVGSIYRLVRDDTESALVGMRTLPSDLILEAAYVPGPGDGLAREIASLLFSRETGESALRRASKLGAMRAELAGGADASRIGVGADWALRLDGVPGCRADGELAMRAHAVARGDPALVPRILAGGLAARLAACA